MQSLLKQLEHSCSFKQRLSEQINANNTDCAEVNACINTQLGLPNAWSLTNFASAVVSAYESHIAAGWADPEFCGEMLACLQTASPAIVDAVATLLNNALATSPNPLLSNLCAYINDCIDTGLLVVSADAGNVITTGTDGWALLLDTDIQAVIKHTIQWASWAATLNPDDIINFTLDNTLSGVDVSEPTAWTIEVKLPNSHSVSTTWNTLTSVVNGNSQTTQIVNTVVNSVDGNGDLITTVNGVASSPLDLWAVLDIDDQQLSSSANTMSLTNGWTAPIVNSNVLSSAWLTLTSTVNWIADSEDITTAVQALIDASTDTVTNTIVGNLIATHIAVDNTSVDINETITSTTAVGTWIQTTNEDGSTNIITFPVINAGTPTAAMEVRVDGNLVTTIPLVQYDVQIDNAGSDFNLVDDQLTFLETNWDSATINFSKYNISAALVTGGIWIYQNGNLITTIPTTASWIAIVDAWNYFTSTDVEWALQELGWLVAGWAFTVTDTTTVDLTKTGSDIQAAVIIDPATDNLIQATANGLFADADAIAHNYDNIASWLTATNVQDAIDETIVKLSSSISRVHIDSWALIQWNVYPDYQEQTMTIAGDRYRSVELPVWYTTLTVSGVKTILHDDTAVRGSFVFDIMNNGTSVHTITLPSWTSSLDTTWLSIPFVDGDKFSVVITTADSGNTVWAEIFISYNLA